MALFGEKCGRCGRRTRHQYKGSATCEACEQEPAEEGSEIAQQCPEGKVANRDTHGHCCWPNQAWNGTRCKGIPASCPKGLHIDTQGERCALPPCGGGKQEEGPCEPG